MGGNVNSFLILKPGHLMAGLFLYPDWRGFQKPVKAFEQ